MNNELIHQKISRYSIETPAKIAAKDELGILSYSEFNARANDIATKLTRLGICKGTIVGVYLPYIKDFAVSAIAVWKVGGIFMPMDDAYPSQRLKYMVENSEDKNFNYTADVNQDSTAMLLYTSGTTGQPKGGTINLAPKFARDDIEFLYQFLQQEKISHAFIPSGLATMLAEDYEITEIAVFAAGENLRNFKAYSKNICLWNCYGSTETGGIMTAKIKGDENPIPIGKPSCDTEIILVDEKFNQVKAGEPSELLVSKNPMSKGYFKLPELTAQKWIKLNGRVWYRTGDLAKCNELGIINLLGRIDNLIKLRGFRIEPGEVEIQVANAVKEINCSNVKNIVVTLKNIRNTDYLVCYYEAEQEIDTNLVKKKISNHLADYMIPEVWVRISSMPRNANGKIIRQELPFPKLKSSHADVLDSEVLLRVIQVAEEITGVVNAYPSDNFTALGGNSLSAMKFSTLLRAQGIKISTPQILKLNELQKIADNAQVDYSKLWSAEQYKMIVKDFSDRGEKIEKVLPLTSEQDELFFQQIFQPDQKGSRKVYMIELDRLISEEDLRQAIDNLTKENEVFRAAIVFHHTPVIQQVITNRKIPLQIVNVEKPDYRKFKIFRNQLMNISVDMQRNSLLQVLCINTTTQSFLFALGFCILFSNADLLTYCANLLSILEEKYPQDSSIREWQEVLRKEPFDSRKSHTNFKQMSTAKFQIPPDIHIYSKNVEPKMVFVHTGNGSSEVYYRMASRIKDYISFAVIEPFNLYHPHEAPYGIKNIAARYVQTLKKYQPTGPYIIGGWCYGGIVAHEMACQLENSGEKVQHLFMLDSHVITDETINELAKNMFSETHRDYFETSPLFEDLREEGMLEAGIKNYLHVSQDVVEHRPAFFHGNVTYFKPEELPLNQSAKSLAYWQKMMQFDAGGFENFCDTARLKIIYTPHEHDLMMDDTSLDIILSEIYRVTIKK